MSGSNAPWVQGVKPLAPPSKAVSVQLHAWTTALVGPLALTTPQGGTAPAGSSWVPGQANTTGAPRFTPPPRVAPTQQQPASAPPISPERLAFLDRFAKLSEKLGKIEERSKKLAAPPAPVTSSIKTATDGKPVAEKAGEGDVADWAAATAALDTFEGQINAVNTACLADASKIAGTFTQRYTAKDKNKPAGKDIVPLYIAYGKTRAALDKLVSDKDGLGALEACPATDAALKAFETAASPTSQQKQTKAAGAFNTLSALSDEELEKKTLLEKAELALDLCANGTPTGTDYTDLLHADGTHVLNADGTNAQKGTPTPGGALEQLCRLYSKSPPDPKFEAKRTQQRDAITAELLKMEELKKLYKSDGALDSAYWNTLSADADKTLALLQKICNSQCDTLKMPHIVVRKDPDPPVKNGTMGGYDPARNDIGLNFWPRYLQPASEAINTIVHETFHAHQDVIVKKLKAGEIAPGDDDYPTALMYMVNDIPVGYVFSSRGGSANYKTQPTEYDSFHNADTLEVDLMGKIKQNAQAGGVTS